MNKEQAKDDLENQLAQQEVAKSRDKVAEHLAAVRRQAFCIEVEVLEGGKLPSKAHRNDAGFDVYATEDLMIYPGQVIKTPLNIRMKLPVGSWARVETKSGLGSKGMLVYAGVVDEGYRGIPHVIATNLSLWPRTTLLESGEVVGTPIIIKKGDKIAQITMNPHSNEFYIEQVQSVDTETSRGTGGFGSSGKQ